MIKILGSNGRESMMKYGRLLMLLGTGLAPLSAAIADPVASQKAAVDHTLDGDLPHLIAVYKDIHAHPELGFAETRTAALLAGEMRKAGFTVTEGVGKTGLVALYRNGPGPAVLVRTELDALPLQEKTGLAYASTVQTTYKGRQTYVDHACGHDAHMAIWLGTARALVAMKDRWHGTLVFVGQPAEEEISGAAAMLADGLYTRFPKPDYAFALHTGAYAYGTVHYTSGAATANADTFEITFKGRGGHGSDPSKTIDPLLIAARFVVDVQSLVSREKDPQKPGVVTVGAIEGGSAGNIIPDRVMLRGTIRNYDEGTRKLLKDGVARVARAEAEMAGAPPPDLAIGTETAVSVINDPDLTTSTGRVFKAAFGDNAVAEPLPITASEDYSLFVNAGVPRSVDFMLGIYPPDRVAAAAHGGTALASNHSPFYAPVPEPTIRTGVEAMSLAVMAVTGGN